MKTEYTTSNFRHAHGRNVMTNRANPMAVTHLGHLMRHFGIQVIGLLASQIWCAWRVGSFVNEYIEAGKYFHFAIALCILLIVDAWVWFTRRGGFSAAFHIPGALLLLSALVPVFALHLRNILRFLE